jgi:SAM-dependent methyltransferase
MAKTQRSAKLDRRRFDDIYNSSIIGAGFFESDDYYRADRERYWRSLKYLCGLDIPMPARILEIGGGQMALLCKLLFGDLCTVADISQEFVAPLRNAEIEHVTFNLMEPETDEKIGERFDVVILLEVIEHIPLPAHVSFARIRPLLKPHGLIFLTTPNLFRIRNLVRMALGIEFLDRFTIPEPGQGLGHQLEYSADHLRWQLERAGLQVMMLIEDSLGRKGHSGKARLARSLLAPLNLRPAWRDGLVAVARVAERSR